MMNRNLRTTLPTLQKNIGPQEVNHNEARQKDHFAKTKYAYFYDKRYSTRSMDSLKSGDSVRVRDQNQKEWSGKATVLQEAETPRSYHIRYPDGRTFRRNRIHLQKIPGENESPSTESILTQQDRTEHTEPAIGKSPQYTSEASIASPKTGTRTRYGRLVKPRRIIDM